jgi:uncharacterized membrane protein YcaP (DUF421 family)
MADWFTLSSQQLIGIFLSVLFAYGLLLMMVRVNGLRTFSKMSGHDFAITIAIGSIIATTVVSKEPSLLQGMLAIAFFLILQTIISKLRRSGLGGAFENTPLLLMDGNTILYENLKKAKIKENDLLSKLREANVLNTNQIRAVVLETTGDISVLHGEGELQDDILKDVQK